MINNSKNQQNADSLQSADTQQRPLTIDSLQSANTQQHPPLIRVPHISAESTQLGAPAERGSPRPTTAVVIGTGNVATHLIGALLQAGVQVVMVYSRTEAHAREAGQRWSIPYTHRIADLPDDAQYYIYSISDNALASMLENKLAPQAIHAHTAGSIGLDLFSATHPRHGVMYPLQTFSKTKSLNFREVPLFIEASSPEVHQHLHSLSSVLSDTVYSITSAQRLQLHLAAVFACNFVNHLYAISNAIVSESKLPFDILRPLIAETASKINYLSPQAAQTGPAARRDTSVINTHLQLLDNNPHLQEIYKLLSNSISKL